ncbi:hypothetical protein HY29_06260 [Hyphomonas beringensis]|uniref:DUF2125 domain-containing protein n=1 Tax=Hyphomonas beringensis TaxID=1280946 RepID=A0A062U470_9PROT|nr:DUF2125 domain-containing protein [Hyphomonas beringensis]KCZ50950.1 hypothetical protein HY29_06260 [Hyphomonas beringensis]
MVEPSTVQKKSRFWLFLPFVLLLIVVAAWTAYWLIARSQLEKGIDEWIRTEQGKGATIEYASKSLSGYPFRFELEVRDPVYQPRGQARWEGETLRLVMQPWNWQHIIAYSPGRNLITEPSALRHTINLDPKSAMSVSWDKTSLNRIGLQLGNATALIRGELYATTGFSLNLAPRKTSPDDMMFAVQWDRLTLNAAPQEAEYLGDTLGPSRLIGEVRNFYPAWERAGGDPERLYESLMEQEGGVEVAQLLLKWGPLDLGAKGDISFKGGKANGTVGLRIDNADDLKAEMEAASRFGQQEQAVITMLEASSKDGGFLTFTIKDNELKMGPLSLGRLPEPRF